MRKFELELEKEGELGAGRRELGAGGRAWGRFCWFQIFFILQLCPCALALGVGQRTVPGHLGPYGSLAPAAVGWASSAAYEPIIPLGLVDPGALTS